MRTLVRLILCVLMMYVPFIALAVTDGRKEAMLWLILPFVVTFPVLLIMAFVFVPAEAALRSQAALTKDILILTLGLFAGIAVAFFIHTNKPIPTEGAMFDTWASSKMVLLWGAVGVTMGVLWRLSDRITKIRWS